jgi:hypothetical protein
MGNISSRIKSRGESNMLKKPSQKFELASKPVDLDMLPDYPRN